MLKRSVGSPAWQRFAAWLCSGLVLVLLLHGLVTGPIAQASESASPVNRGVQAYRSGDYPGALKAWKQALQLMPPGSPRERGILAENLARVSQQLGQTIEAVDYWQQALVSHQALGDRAEQARVLVEQGQGYNRLGHHQRSLGLLCEAGGQLDSRDCGPESAVGLARSLGNRSTEIAALGALAETYRLMGRYEAALGQVTTAKQMAADASERSYQLPLLIGEGSIAESLARVNDRRSQIAKALGDDEPALVPQRQAETDRQRARVAFESALALARQGRDDGQELGLLLRLAGVYDRQGELGQAASVRQSARELLGRVPESQAKVFAMLDWMRLMEPSGQAAGQAHCMSGSVLPGAKALLEEALPIATRLKNPRALSLVQGELGHVAECQGDLGVAFRWTKAASLTVDSDAYAKDVVYLWDWQLGRILTRQGQVAGAIGMYKDAVATLESIRGEMVGVASDLQFDFRDQIEPVYRELVALQLEQVSPSRMAMTKGLKTRESSKKESEIRAVLKTVDSLKLAELQNYFGSDCAIAQTTDVTEVKTDQVQTAVISTIIFPKRTAVLARFPGGQTQVSWIDRDRESLRTTVDEFRRGLETHFREFEPGGAQQVYDWLIRPFEGQLKSAGIKTLVFVHDGPFRSVPMAALHDGQGFLVERYAIAVTPSLRLTAPRPLAQTKLSALALGLTEEVRIGADTFSALSNVERELASVAGQIPGTKRLLNREFNRGTLEGVLGKEHFPILHIATHGKFGSEPQNNFLVMGDGTKLTIQELDGLIRRVVPRGEPIELLALTACETAIGDERATLGLAGVAIRAGARSAIASLWSIDDGATAEVVEGFYGGLRGSGVNKAEALRLAQVGLIRQGGEKAHPAKWAPLVLIGNWL